MPGLEIDDEAEATRRGADFFERGIGDTHPRPAVDQQQLPLQSRQSRRPFRDNGIEKRPHPELLGALASQRDFRDAALNHLDADQPAANVLRRNDRPAQVISGLTIQIAYRSSDCRQIGLRDFFSEERLIDRCDLFTRNGVGTAQRHLAQFK